MLSIAIKEQNSHFEHGFENHHDASGESMAAEN